MNISLIKKLDAVIGRMAVLLLSRPEASSIPGGIAKILIIRPGGIGDAVLLAPAVTSLKNRFPHIHITILAEQRNTGVFPLIPGVDELLRYDRQGEFFKALRTRYDVVIDTEQWHRMSAVIARMVPSPVKIGFDTNERRRVFTHSIPYSHDDYEAASFANLLTPLGIDARGVEMGPPFLFLPAAARQKAVGLLEPLSGNPFVVIFPGASIAERRWGADRFRRVAKQLAEGGFQVVVVGGPEDRENGDLIVGAWGVNLAGMTTLAESAAVIARSSLVISGDSGVLHLAVGLGIATVSLFGSGIAAKWAPQGERHVVLNQKLSCSPCTRFGTTPPCPKDNICMKKITADQVMAAAVHLLYRECR